MLIDRADEGTEPRVLFIIDHAVRDGGHDKHGRQRVISQRMQFVLIDSQGGVTQGGHAPYLDWESPSDDERALLGEALDQPWLQRNLEAQALTHAVKTLVPDHLTEVKERRQRLVDATLAAVQERLTKEINHWMHRYLQLKQQADAGKQPRMQPENARRRATELTERLQQRTAELEKQRHVVSATPVVVGGTLVIPQGWLDRRSGKSVPPWSADPEARARIERIAMEAVMQAERDLGHEPEDVSAAKYGWDVQSRVGDGEVRFIEVKGRAKGATTVTVTKNEILAALNQPERFILALVLADDGHADGPYYLRHPFQQEPDFGVTSINFNLDDLLRGAETPR